MCKHVRNAAVLVRFPCCLKFFECIECHDDFGGHPAKYAAEMVFQCKSCDRCFRKDLRNFGAADEECPYCGVLFMMEADTPAAKAGKEAEMDELQKRARENAAAKRGTLTH